MGVSAAIVEAPLNPEAILRELPGSGDGAVNLFLGVVRDHHAGRSVLRLEYHAYEEMALPLMRQIAEETRERFAASSVSIVHRIGTLEVGEISVAVAVAAPHRAEAFDGARHAMERLKREVPIWKKEHFKDGSAWVDGDAKGG